MKKIFWLFFFFLAISIVPVLCQASTTFLSNASPNHTIASGSIEKVYGSSASNQITLESGARVELINFPGQNVIEILVASDGFTVYRSGTLVTFQGTDGTVLKIPATHFVQTVKFNDRTALTLNVFNNQVMLDDQVIGLEENPVSGSNAYKTYELIGVSVNGNDMSAQLSDDNILICNANDTVQIIGKSDPNATFRIAVEDPLLMESRGAVEISTDKNGIFYYPKGTVFEASKTHQLPDDGIFTFYFSNNDHIVISTKNFDHTLNDTVGLIELSFKDLGEALPIDQLEIDPDIKVAMRYEQHIQNGETIINFDLDSVERGKAKLDQIYGDQAMSDYEKASIGFDLVAYGHQGVICKKGIAASPITKGLSAFACVPLGLHLLKDISHTAINKYERSGELNESAADLWRGSTTTVYAVTSFGVSGDPSSSLDTALFVKDMFDGNADLINAVRHQSSNNTEYIETTWNHGEIKDIKVMVIPSKEAPQKGCGAYVAPGVWKDFDCYNLAAIGKTTNDDPFIPSWRLIGGYWYWGSKGPDPSQWYDTNFLLGFAHGPTGPDPGEANSDSILPPGMSISFLLPPDGAWKNSDGKKTVKDPCPTGYHIPTKDVWENVLRENEKEYIGSTWTNSATSYETGLKLGDSLFLPAAGYRSGIDGRLTNRGYDGHYWSSSEGGSCYYAWDLHFNSGVADTDANSRLNGFSVRCVAE